MKKYTIGLTSCDLTGRRQTKSRVCFNDKKLLADVMLFFKIIKDALTFANASHLKGINYLMCLKLSRLYALSYYEIYANTLTLW